VLRSALACAIRWKVKKPLSQPLTDVWNAVPAGMYVKVKQLVFLGQKAVRDSEHNGDSKLNEQGKILYLSLIAK
jgi:hypothetical protein